MTPIEAYLSYLKEQGRAPTTLRAVKSDLSGFKAWWQQTYKWPFSVQQLATRDICRWQVKRQQVDGAKPNTINRTISSLRGFCQWSIRENLRVDNPVSEIDEVVMPKLAPKVSVLKLSMSC